ncbi:hypothetical protein FF011L_05990 [Roseimaritima multifibrata]|uniref:Uncharacterized protein n=1 Tax=Roseimaritima multifibrata TaxID=1930274 RepID=A0A517MAF2_9BACT|nr:hypothetical protein FF011L_05990 [Roseimaritima multifibrata]
METSEPKGGKQEKEIEIDAAKLCCVEERFHKSLPCAGATKLPS